MEEERISTDSRMVCMVEIITIFFWIVFRPWPAVEERESVAFALGIMSDGMSRSHRTSTRPKYGVLLTLDSMLVGGSWGRAIGGFRTEVPEPSSVRNNITLRTVLRTVLD